jgi:hypothetical protein
METYAIPKIDLLSIEKVLPHKENDRILYKMEMLVDGVSKPVFFITLTDRLTFKVIGRVRDFASELKKHRDVIDGTYKGNI